MKFEKINENKIRITLKLSELKDKDIDYQSLMSNSMDTQKLFWDMLDEAEEKIGFKTKDYKIMIEALATVDGDFIVTVTRSLPESNYENKKRKNIKYKRKNEKLSSSLAIYSFDTFDDFCEFCLYINSNSLIVLDKISKNYNLFTYKDKYFLVINNIDLSYENLSIFNYIVSEFGHFVSSPETFNSILLEHGNLIIKRNAIKNILKYFY